MVACSGERWGDNAAAFLRYMNDHHPEKEVFAVVKNKTIAEDKRIDYVERNRLSTLLLIMQAKVFAFTHTLSDIGPYQVFSFSNAQKIWLQHGVIAIGKITASKARLDQYDMICASSKKEERLMVSELGIKPEVIKITGLARHDYLRERVQSQLLREGILFIPTQRNWIGQFQETIYENLILSWVNSHKLSDIKNYARLKIWLHPGWHRQGMEGMGQRFEEVEYYGLDYDPQALISESKVLVTDYSSIYFDAAISGIPTVFYQPDREEYIARKGIFKDFLTQDLLLVVDNKHELIDHLNKLMTDDEYYKKRVKADQSWAYQYVETFDGNCCDRIYEEILRLLAE